jgi:membrane protein YdbS with pleckstrin-like domain
LLPTDADRGSLDQPSRDDAPLDRPQRLDPRSVTAGRIGGWIFLGVLALFFLPGLLVAIVLGAGVGAWMGLLATLAGLALLAIPIHLGPLWRYRHTWYRVDASGIEIGRGRLFQHLVTVPHARIQHLDVNRGPLARRLGLATLVIYTAGHAHGEIKIEGLSHDAALRLRERLVGERGGDAV